MPAEVYEVDSELPHSQRGKRVVIKSRILHEKNIVVIEEKTLAKV